MILHPEHSANKGNNDNKSKKCYWYENSATAKGFFAPKNWLSVADSNDSTQRIQPAEEDHASQPVIRRIGKELARLAGANRGK